MSSINQSIVGSPGIPNTWGKGAAGARSSLGLPPTSRGVKYRLKEELSLICAPWLACYYVKNMYIVLMIMIIMMVMIKIWSWWRWWCFINDNIDWVNAHNGDYYNYGCGSNNIIIMLKFIKIMITNNYG